MKNIRALFLILAIGSFARVSATTGDTIHKKKVNFQDTLEKASILYDSKAYMLALPLFQYLLDNDTDKKKLGFYRYRLGICCLYKSDQNEKALSTLLQVEAENKKAADIDFYIGRAYMLNYKFDDAIMRFTGYTVQKNALPEFKTLAEQYIANCNNGKELMAHPADVKITNLGEPINSAASEYVPVISSDESVLIFTYRGPRSTGGLQPFDINDPGSQYTEDVLMSVKTGDEWMEPFTAGPNINSADHDACIALSGDGQKLFVFKNGVNDNGDIYMSYLTGNNWGVPEHLRGDVNSKYWEGSCSITANERILYFSSERPGGYGGRDIYKALLQQDGSWGNVKNLGPQINTPFDDDAPFIHPDGTTLIFSSKGHKSMGGYDIFKSFRIDTSWTTPENMGYPINTAGDDIYYVLSADGKRGYYSTEKAGGLGRQDIYTVGPGLPGWKPALVLLKGNITVNDVPAQADVEVVLANSKENIGIYKSNASTGKYLINLPAGADYKIIYTKFGYEEQTKLIKSTKADSFSSVNFDVQFYDKLTLNQVNASGKKITAGEQKGRSRFIFSTLSDDSLLLFKLEGKGADSIREVSVLLNEVTQNLTRCKDNYFCFRAAAKKLAPVAEIPFGKEKNYADILTTYGDLQTDGLVFKVQIGAYKIPKNFKYEKLNSLGKVSRKDYADELTRFSIGSCKTLNEADKLLKQVLAKGCGDAFVTVYYEGKRFLLHDLGTLKK